MNNESKQEKGRNKLRDCLQTAQWMWRVKYEWELLWREAKGSPFVATRRVDSSREIKRKYSRASVTSYMDIFAGCVQSKQRRNLNLDKLAHSKHFLSFGNCRNWTDFIHWQQANSCEWWSNLHQVFSNKIINVDVSLKVTYIIFENLKETNFVV